MGSGGIDYVLNDLDRSTVVVVQAGNYALQGDMILLITVSVVLRVYIFLCFDLSTELRDGSNVSQSIRLDLTQRRLGT